MKKIISYTVVAEPYLNQLQQSVATYIGRGFEPHGSMVYSAPERTGDGSPISQQLFMQPMVEYEII